MGRKPLTEQEILQRELAKLEKLTGYKPTEQPVVTNQKEKSREAEAVLFFFEKPEKFREKECSNCHKIFLVNYPSAGKCSDRCRQEALEAIGILWNPNKSAEERWAPSDVPLTIPPAALVLLMQAAEKAQQSSAPSQ